MKNLFSIPKHNNKKYYRLVLVSHGQGTAFIFLYLCWVAQPVRIIRTRMKKTKLRPLVFMQFR
jgi:hypothetical protein